MPELGRVPRCGLWSITGQLSDHALLGDPLSGPAGEQLPFQSSLRSPQLFATQYLLPTLSVTPHPPTPGQPPPLLQGLGGKWAFVLSVCTLCEFVGSETPQAACAACSSLTAQRLQGVYQQRDWEEEGVKGISFSPHRDMQGLEVKVCL